MDGKELLELANEQSQEGNFAEAIEYYKKYLENDSRNALILNRIGHLYGKIDEFKYVDEQIKYFEKALEIKPDYTLTIRNLAFAYQKVDKYQKAVECFLKIFELDPVMDDYFAYSCLKIQLGDFEEGWKYHDSRFLKKFGQTYYPKFDKPKWEGQKISDKTLLVHYEQGYGDSIQFFRYLEQLKPLVGKIIFIVQKGLYDLLKFNANGIEVVKTLRKLDDGIDEWGGNIAFDYHIPLMSLPYILNARIDNIPLSQGYIKADEDKVKAYKEEFFNNDCFKIGISWSGAKVGNRKRDIPLETFYPLAKQKNVKVYSFQKNFGSEQLENLPSGVEIVDLGARFNDFSDTAAAMANLDLFVTSDNGVFNLAAAMGKKTFLMLNKHAEWRWFFDEDTTPWYDSVRIFKKQSESESWDSLMQKIIKNLSQD